MPHRTLSRETLRPIRTTRFASHGARLLEVFVLGGGLGEVFFGPDGMPCAVLRRPEALDCRVGNPSTGLSWTLVIPRGNPSR